MACTTDLAHKFRLNRSDPNLYLTSVLKIIWPLLEFETTSIRLQKYGNTQAPDPPSLRSFPMATGHEIKPPCQSFSKLPAEIQLKIWETAAQDPSVICICQEVDVIGDPTPTAPKASTLLIYQMVLQKSKYLSVPQDAEVPLDWCVYESPRFSRQLRSICFESRRIAQAYEESYIEEFDLDLYFYFNSDREHDQTFVERIPSTVKINWATDTVFLTSRMSLDLMHIIALAVTMREGADELRNLAISHRWFEGVEFLSLLDNLDFVPDNAGSFLVPSYGRLVRLFSMFPKLKNLDIVIGEPVWAYDLEDIKQRGCNDVTLMPVDPLKKVPEDFMITFRRTFWPAEIPASINKDQTVYTSTELDIVWSKLEQDMNAFFEAGKACHLDTEEWNAKDWNAPRIRFKSVRQEPLVPEPALNLPPQA